MLYSIRCVPNLLPIMMLIGFCYFLLVWGSWHKEHCSYGYAVHFHWVLWTAVDVNTAQGWMSSLHIINHSFFTLKTLKVIAKLFSNIICLLLFWFQFRETQLFSCATAINNRELSMGPVQFSCWVWAPR